MLQEHHGAFAAFKQCCKEPSGALCTISAMLQRPSVGFAGPQQCCMGMFVPFAP
jgi:hypothetical protein